MPDAGQAVILAGGKGTRLAAILGNAPKPMVPVLGAPLLARQIALLAEQGFCDVVLLVGHRQEVIRGYFGDGARFGVSLRYFADEPPLGTAGALIGARDALAPRFVVLFGDTLLDVDLRRAVVWHTGRGAEVTLFVHPNDHPHDSDIVVADDDGRVAALVPYPHPTDRDYRNLVNAALYVVERAVIAGLPHPERPADIAKNMVPALIAAGRRVYAYRSTEYIKDIGTPERLAAAERDLTSGKVAACRLDRKRPTVFLDRDGTLNIDTGWIDRPERMTLVHDAGEAVRRINRAGNLAVVVTNQPVVARGACDEATLDAIHARLETLLGRERAWLDGLHYCPHHPDGGFHGERPELKLRCDCRKPAPGLIRRAAATLPIDLGASCLIGDRLADVGAARAAGIPSIVIGSNGTQAPQPAAAAEADFAFDRLTEAAIFATESLPGLLARARALAEEVQPGAWVLIGGPAFAGKSTLARALRFALRARGVEPTIVALDGWILSADARDNTTIQGRFDTAGLAAMVELLAGLTTAAALRLPRYDRRRRVSIPDAETLDAWPGATLIFEGVAGFLVEPLVRRTAVRIFLDAGVAVRRDRFRADYASRGFAPTAIDQLFEAREQEEVNLLRTMMSAATTIIRDATDDHYPDAA